MIYLLSFLLCSLVIHGGLPWIVGATETFDELDSWLLDVNGSAQSIVDQFLASWTGNGTFLPPAEQNPGQKVEGFSLFRRACPLGNGQDCVPNDICCSSSDGAFCCMPDHPVCCGKVGDGWCCPGDTSCCGRNCCNPGYTCCGTIYGKANCCGDGQICCNQSSDNGHCCDEDQKCDSNGCIDPTETVTATTTVIKTESDKTTITVTSNTTVERTSTSESIEITTLSNVATATVLITKTKTITDSSSTVAKRWAAAIPDATPAVQDSLERRVDSLHLSNTDLVDEGAVVYLRAAPSLDVIADFLMARNITIQRRDTVTDTEWETETSTYVSTSTVVSTEWETEYTTSVEIDYVTRSSYIAADTTVTSTTTTTIHIAAGSTDTSGDDKKAKDDGSGDSDNSNSNSGNGSSGGSNDKGAIIGGAVGGAAGVVLLAVIAFLLLRRRKRSNEPSAPNAMPPAAIAGTHDSGMYGPPQSPHSGMQQVSPAGAGIDVAQDSRQDPKRGQSPWSNRGSSTHMQAHEVDAGYPFRSNINAPVHEADTVYPYERNNPAELDSRQQGDMAGTNPPRYGY